MRISTPTLIIATLLGLVTLLAYPVAGQDAGACVAFTNAAAAGEAAYAQADYATALTAYGCAVNGNRSDVPSIVGRMEAALHLDRFSIAVNDAMYLKDYASETFDGLLQDYDRMIEVTPGNLPALRCRALLYWASAQDNDALRDYEAILRVDTENVFARVFRASSNQYLGDPYTPPADFQYAINVAPDNADIFAIMGSTYAQTYDEANALMALNRALQMNPTDARSYYFRGLVYLWESSYAQAEADFNAAMQHDPYYIDPVYDLGLAEAQQSNYSEAVTLFTRAIEINPRFRLAYLSRGAIYEQQANAVGAAADLYQYVQLNQAFVNAGGSLNSAPATSFQMDEGAVMSYSFSGTAGQQVTFTASAARDVSDPLIVLLDPLGTPVAASDDVTLESYTASIQDFILTANGEYTLLVTHSDGGDDGAVEVSANW